MANNFGSNRPSNRGQEGGNYFDNAQQYNSDQNIGPYYDSNPNGNQRGARDNSFTRGSGNDPAGRSNGDRSARGGQRGRGTRSTGGRGRGTTSNDGGGQRGGRGARGSFDPLPARIDWVQQLENDRQQASLNWAPSFRNASIPIPPQFYAHTKDEQLVLGQELMDLAAMANSTAHSGAQLTPPTTIPPLLDIDG